MGKLYEHMVRARLETELEAGEGLSERQFGFRKGRSTIQAVEYVLSRVRQSNLKACALVAVDVQNAFNTASWAVIMSELRRRKISGYLVNIISSYFEERQIEVSKGKHRMLTTGVPQGSILGPLLWNILYDGILRIDMVENTETVCFADDLLIIVAADYLDDLEFAANETLRRVDVWMKAHYLELAPNKTEAVVVKGSKKIRENVIFRLREQRIVPTRSIKYLGIKIDGKLKFDEHIRYAVEKAEKSATALTRLMPNIGGPQSSKRVVLYMVVQSVLLYGAPIWHAATSTGSCKEKLQKIQRKMLLRVVGAYRTVSTVALQVIASTAPLDLLAEERKRLYHTVNSNTMAQKRTARVLTMEKWQERWNANQEKGQWTKKLIPNIMAWVNREHGNVEYYLTQFLTGHGSLKTYTKRIGKDTDDCCIYFGQVDTAEHTFFVCVKWAEHRTMLYTELGHDLNADNIVLTMLKGKKEWLLIHGAVRNIMKGKEEGEREYRRLRAQENGDR